MLVTYFVLLASSIYVVASDPPVQSESPKVNNFLTGKWENWHASLDVNHDGLLSTDDVETLRKYYATLGSLGVEQRKHIVDTKERLMKTYLFGGRSTLSADEFVEVMKSRYESDKARFFQELLEFDRQWFHLTDLNKDDLISEQEVLIDMLSEGHSDIAKDETLFSSFELVNGQLPVQETIEYFFRFQTEKDKSKADIINQAMESGF